MLCLGASLQALHEGGKMEGPLLPEGPGGEEPPEEPQGHQEKYELGLSAAALEGRAAPVRRRRFSDYTNKNCEEASGERRAT